MSIDLTYPQTQAFFAREENVAVVAGFGSGKTTTAVVKAFDNLLEFPGVPVGYAAPTYGDIETIWYPAVEKHCLENGFKFKILKKEHVIQLPGLGNIICRSLSNPDKIVGFEVGDFLIDEIDILKEEQAKTAYFKCKARCRYHFPKKRLRKIDGTRTKKKKVKESQQFIFTTPEGYKFTYKHFKKEPFDNSRLIQMSTFSNEHNLQPNYVKSLLAIYPPELVKAYILGQFTNLRSGAVYPSYDLNKNNTNAREVKGETLHIGMDFNVQRMCSIIHVIRGNCAYAVGEIVNKLDTPDMIFAIKALYPNHPIYIYPDATGGNRDTGNASLTDIKMLKNAGFFVKNNPKNPYIKDRVMSVNAMLCNALGIRRYFINKKRCPVYSENLSQQIYDKYGLPEKTTNMDHTNDAGGYFINYVYSIVKPVSNVLKLNFKQG